MEQVNLILVIRQGDRAWSMATNYGDNDEKAYEVGVHVEDAAGDLSRVPTGQSELELTEREERALVRKIDFVLLPILSLLYACALLDRVNISAARVDGMGKELGLLNPKQNYYSITLLVFFPAYL